MMRNLTHPRLLMDGIAFGESPRWHEDRLWFADWSAEELIAVDLEGRSEVIAHVPSFPFSIDWLPDGRLVVISARHQALLTVQPDGTLARHTDLSGLTARPPNNEIVVDGRGNAYIDGGGFDMLAGEPFAPGLIALITPGGEPRQVADGLAFPNGMAVTPDNATLIVAESHGRCLTAFTIAHDGSLHDRRVWADLGDGAPDGICIDANGAVWYADVPNRHCVRVREGGEVLQTVSLDRGCFACILGGPERRTLFVVAREWRGVSSTADGERSGQILCVEVDVPGAGWPY
jgi:sugar lactone lactonase YvrE